MIAFIGLGANLPSAFGAPQDTVCAALGALAAEVGPVVTRSRLWRTAPVPPSGQPWYVNAVAQVDTALAPAQVLVVLKALETRFGRALGTERNAPRALDLDLLDHGGFVLGGPSSPWEREGLGSARKGHNPPPTPPLQGREALGRPLQGGDDLVLPHPRMAGRAFVLYPLQEVATDWVHPASGLSVRALIDALPEGQEIEVLDASA